MKILKQNLNLNFLFYSSYPNLNKIHNIKNKKQIFYKNYLYFFLILSNFFFLNNSFKLKKISFNFKKKKISYKTYLNAPNRHKKSLTKLQFNFFLFQLSLYLFYCLLINNLFFFLKHYFIFFKKLFFFFESYLLSMKKKQIFFSLNLKYKALLK